jgi:hypothetical protein
MNTARRPPARRFTLIDIAVLIAATAAVLPVWREYLREGRMYPYGLLYLGGPGRPGWVRLVDRAWPWIVRALPFLVAAAPTLLSLRFLGPRPKRAFRRPGTVACVAVTAVSTLALAQHVACLPRNMQIRNPVTFCLTGLEGIGRAVAVAWLVVALAVGWRPCPDWIDRAGRLLGALLIAIAALAFARPFGMM